MIPTIGKAIISKLADKAGISIGGHDGSPFPTVDQLKQFALGAAEVALKKAKDLADSQKPNTKFAYAVGHYWPTGGVGVYTFGSSTFYGTMKEAEEFLEYVKAKSPDRDWKIFMLVEVPR